MYNKPNMKVNNSDNKILDPSTLIQANQYNTDKHGERKLEKLRIRYLRLVS